MMRMASSSSRAPADHTAPPIGSLSPHAMHGVPNEIVLLIAEFLEPPDLYSLIRTSRRFASLLDSRLYDLAATFVRPATRGPRTALTWASVNGVSSVIKKLLERNADLRVTDNDGFNALHHAVRLRHESIVRMLLAAGFNHSVRAARSERAIHLAARNGDEAILRLILDAGGIISLLTMHKRTALHEAASEGHLGAVRLLLDAGANIFLKDSYWCTPLLLAIRGGHLNVVKMLLDAGSDLDAKDSKGETALHLACSGGNIETVNHLVQLYKRNGMDIQETNPSRMSALHLAAGKGHVGIVRILVANGLDPRGVCNKHPPPLHVASWNGHESVVEFLIQIGVDIELCDDEGKRALHWAAHCGKTTVAQFLLEKGADITAVDAEGWTPLHTAAWNGTAEIYDLLVSYGADINAAGANMWLISERRANSGYRRQVFIPPTRDAELRPPIGDWTPLYIAMEGGNGAVGKRLLENTAKFQDGDTTLQTALYLAFFGGRTPTLRHLMRRRELVRKRLVNMLLSKGADPLQLDGYGRTCMDWAALHQPTFNRMKPYCANYTPTDKAVTAAILRNSIFTFATKLREVPPDKQAYQPYYILGKCLAFANDFQETTTAFNVYLSLAGHYYCVHLRHWAENGDIFICTSCPNIVTCSSCGENYTKQEVPYRLCHGHQFAPIPLRRGPGNQASEERVNDSGESRNAWLSRLADSYSDSRLI